MRKTVYFLAVVALNVITLPAWSQDLASIKTALQDKYALTTTTADKTDIVKAGDVLVLKKNGLITVGVHSPNTDGNKYTLGKIQPNAFAVLRKKFPPPPGTGDVDREFVTGEKLWVTDIEVKGSGIKFALYTDAYSDIRYKATLMFPLEKSETLTLAKALTLVGEVFEVQRVETAKDQNPQQPAKVEVAPPPLAPPPPPPLAPPPPPPLASPPPPPADPKTIALGQTIETVTKNFGPPESVRKLAGTQQVYVYKDMKVTFNGGKVTDVQ